MFNTNSVGSLTRTKTQYKTAPSVQPECDPATCRHIASVIYLPNAEWCEHNSAAHTEAARPIDAD